MTGFHLGSRDIRQPFRRRRLHHPRGSRDAEQNREAAKAPVCHRLAGFRGLHREGLCEAEVPRIVRPEGDLLHDQARRAAAQDAEEDALQIEIKYELSSCVPVSKVFISVLSAMCFSLTFSYMFFISTRFSNKLNSSLKLFYFN